MDAESLTQERRKNLDVTLKNNNQLSYDPDKECEKLVRKIRYLIEAKGMSICRYIIRQKELESLHQH